MEDEAQVNLLRAQAKSPKFDLAFRDFSIKEPFGLLWKMQCKPIIEQTSLTIGMIGALTHMRDAVEWELNTSYELHHKVFGVLVYRDKQHPIPKPLLDHGAVIVPWELDVIIRELDSDSVPCHSKTSSGFGCRRRVKGSPPCWQH